MIAFVPIPKKRSPGGSIERNSNLFLEKNGLRSRQICYQRRVVANRYCTTKTSWTSERFDSECRVRGIARKGPRVPFAHFLNALQSWHGLPVLDVHECHGSRAVKRQKNNFPLDFRWIFAFDWMLGDTLVLCITKLNVRERQCTSSP